MYVLNSNITIGEFSFGRINEVKINSSSKKISDTCTIKVPTTAKLKRKDEITETESAKKFNVGDYVRVELGYGNKTELEFEGYVKRINHTTPLLIECEDAIYQLRKNNYKKAFKDTSLRNVIDFLLEGTDISITGNVPNINFTEYYIKDSNGAEVLQKLKDEYGLNIYMISLNEMHVGYANTNDRGQVLYRIGENVINSNLKYRLAEDIKLKVKAVHISKDNKKVEKEAGDKKGEVHTRFFYDIEDPDQLQLQAEQELKRFKYDGYDGSLTTFLLPRTQHGAKATLEDPNFPDRGGKYFIDKITTTFGQGGARRKVELGVKVED